MTHRLCRYPHIVTIRFLSKKERKASCTTPKVGVGQIVLSTKTVSSLADCGIDLEYQWIYSSITDRANMWYFHNFRGNDNFFDSLFSSLPNRPAVLWLKNFSSVSKIKGQNPQISLPNKSMNRVEGSLCRGNGVGTPVSMAFSTRLLSSESFKFLVSAFSYNFPVVTKVESCFTAVSSKKPISHVVVGTTRQQSSPYILTQTVTIN